MKTLKDLTDDELLEYHSLMSGCTKRALDVNKHGYSTKFAYHVVRLLSEVEQILTEQDLDLTRNREQLKSIRRGEWTRGQIIDFYHHKEKSLEQIYLDSTLQYKPDEKVIKNLLMNCLEHHYGSLDGCINASDDEGTEAVRKLAQIETILRG